MRLTELEEAVSLAGEHRDEEAEADKARQKAHGIVHTPPALARSMAASVDRMLKERLGLRGGLADPKVGILDPACGPGAFLAACFAIAGDRKTQPGYVGGWDLDVAAIARADEALRPAFGQAGWSLELRGQDTLSVDPARVLGGRAKVLVVLGNPPWASKSQNRGAVASEALLEDFRRDPTGERLAERKIGVLSDDYVRFFRWSAEAIRRSPGGGVLSLVTNASWLDGPVHRGMRAALARWFAAIDVVDLGGSALLARGTERDDNVFGVRPAVSIATAVRPAKHGELVEGGLVRYARLRGTRDEKLEKLQEELEFEVLPPHASGFVFRPGAVPARRSADEIGLHEAMPFHREGVQTNRDKAVIAESAPVLLARLRAFVDGRTDVPELASALEGSGHYDPAAAREAIAKALAADPDGTLGLACRPIAYRPFDERVFSPVAPFCHRPRPDLLEAMGHSPFALVSVRKDRGERAWTHFGAVRHVPDNCFLSNRSSARTRAFPSHGPDGTPNLDAAVAAKVSERAGAEVDSVAFAHYVLAILASSTFRASRDVALRLDYPSIPLPPDAAGFARLVDAGAALASAFLAPAGAASTVVGHWNVSSAPDALPAALERAERAYVDAFGAGA
ncbi:MAG: type ISP restriction/modification enzyme [Polyangiales bacterium]